MNNEVSKEAVNMYIEYPVMTSKEVRKFGRDLGYGVTMGVFSAMFTVNMMIGIMKAIKKRSEKKADATDKTGPTIEFKDDEEENTEA